MVLKFQFCRGGNRIVVDLLQWMMGDESFGDKNQQCCSDDDLEETDNNYTTGLVPDNRQPSAETAADCQQSNSMAERERRNVSRVERTCSNAMQSKNHLRHQDTSEPARNRHREGIGATGSIRNRTIASTIKHAIKLSTSNQSGEASAEMASSEASALEDGMVEDVVDMSTEQPTSSSASIKPSDFLGSSSEAINIAMSTHNWQVSLSNCGLGKSRKPSAVTTSNKVTNS